MSQNKNAAVKNAMFQPSLTSDVRTLLDLRRKTAMCQRLQRNVHSPSRENLKFFKGAVPPAKETEARGFPCGGSFYQRTMLCVTHDHGDVLAGRFYGFGFASSGLEGPGQAKVTEQKSSGRLECPVALVARQLPGPLSESMTWLLL